MIHLSNVVQEKISRLNKKSPKKNANSSSFEIDTESEISNSNEIASTKSVDNSFWILQEMGDYKEDQNKMKEVGDMLLHELRKLQFSLISSALSNQNIIDLKNSLEKSNIALKFPELQSVVDDINLRVEVELAKL